MKLSLTICFLELSDEIPVGTQKQVQINYGKRIIGIRAIEVWLYIQT